MQMKKKSTSNSVQSFPLDLSTNDGGNDFVFVYWDDVEKELEELILFNSINDTHRPEELNNL